MKNLDNINNLNSYGFSLYSAYSLTKKTELFARYDRLLYKGYDNQLTNNKKSIIGGISHSPVKGVNLSLNYQGCLLDETSNQNENSILLSMAYKF